MTTTVKVEANHGWRVRVTPVNPTTNEQEPPQYVEAGQTGIFAVWAGRDLLIHEVQPGEEDSR